MRLYAVISQLENLFLKYLKNVVCPIDIRCKYMIKYTCASKVGGTEHGG